MGLVFKPYFLLKLPFLLPKPNSGCHVILLLIKNTIAVAILKTYNYEDIRTYKCTY